MADAQLTRFQAFSDRVVQVFGTLRSGLSLPRPPTRAIRPVAQKVPAVRGVSLQNAWEHAFRQGLTNASNALVATSYGASITGYACVQYNANSMAAVDLAVLDSKGQPYEAMPPQMAHLLDNRRRLLWLISASCDLWGEAFLRKRRNAFINSETGRGYPSQLDWLNPVDVEKDIDAVDETLRGFWVGREYVYPDDIIWITGFDPRDNNGAISPFEVALRNISIERNMAEFAARWFLNGARPGGIVSIEDAAADDEYIKEVRAEWNKLFKGVDNAHSTAIFGSAHGVTYTPLQSPLKDLAMEALDKQDVSKICAALRTNPVLVGLAYVADALSAQNTRTQIERNHYHAVTIPDLMRVLEALNKQWTWTEFNPQKQFTLVPDTSGIAALSDLTDARGQLARNMYESDILDRSESRVYVGYEPTPPDALPFERNPTNAIAALQAGAMSLAQFQQFMHWPTWGVNSDVVQVGGIWYPVDKLQDVAQNNAAQPFSFGPAMPGMPLLPTGPESPGATPESLPANIEASQSLNGAQISSALAVMAGIVDGSVAPEAAVELLNALGIQRDRAQRMVKNQKDVAVVPVSPSEMATSKLTATTQVKEGEFKPVEETPDFLQRKELTNWQRKVERKGADQPFEPEHLPDDVYQHVRAALDAGTDPTLVFEAARNWLTTGEPPDVRATAPDPTPEPEPDDDGDHIVTPEEAAEYWQHYDALKQDIGQDWLGWMQGVRSAALEHILDNPTADVAFEDHFDTTRLAEQWIGTEDEHGPILALTFAGMVAGNEAMKRGISINPDNARAAPTMIVGWDVLFQEALDYAREYTDNLIRYINETTFARIREMIAAWIESGADLTELRNQLDTIFEDKKRSELIAQTETTRVYNAGAHKRYENAGVTEVRSYTVRDTKVCPICKRNAKEGPVSMAEGWPERDSKGNVIEGGKRIKHPPFHPGCRCPTGPVMKSVKPPALLNPSDIDSAAVSEAVADA